MTTHSLERPGSGRPRSSIRRRRRGLLLAGSLIGSAVVALPAAASDRAPLPADTAVVVVTAPGTSAHAAVADVGGRVTRALPLVHGVAARVPRGALVRLRASPGVRAAVRDRALHPRGETTVDADAGLTLRQVRTLVGADRLPASVPSGADVDVALVDTGVAPVRGLDGGTVVDGPDFSADRDVPAQEHLDAFGHGTHMAGIIGADDGPARFSGVAPGSRIVNVRVADHDGATSLSRMLAGIDWVVRNRKRDGLNVRVLNLAFGAEVTGSYRTDPLAYAVEQAWQRGIVVVTAAGNGGSGTSGLDSPAYDPYVLAVGAADTVGTDTPADDVLADFSSIGTPERTPDVVAPGVGIVSLRVPGGLLDEQFPGARIGDSWFRGSGTSQAAAVVSGAAALLLERRPDLDPDEVKALLRGTAHPLAGVAARGQGAGVIDVAAALSAPVGDATQRWPRATAGGVWRARGGLGLQLAVERNGGQDWSSRSWRSRSWRADDWASRSWRGDDWASRSWRGDDWASRSWRGDDWASRSWRSLTWSGSVWEAPTE
jgi:serine protease AprX